MSQDTDEALRGEDAANVVREAFDGAPVHLLPEERDAVRAWLGCLAGITEIAASPSAIEQERSLIGHLVNDPGALLSAADSVRPEHFAQRELGEVLRVLVELHDASRAIDPPTVVDHLRSSSKVDAPWRDVLSACQSAWSSSSSAADKARSVFGHWRNRKLQALGAALYHRAAGAGAHDSTDLLDLVTDELTALELPADARAVDMGIGEAVSRLREDVEVRQREGGKLPGVSTGLDRLDWYLGGLSRPSVIVVKADTGVGKTGFGLTLAANIARRSVRATSPEDQHLVVVVSLEMRATQVGLRVVANVGDVDGMNVRLARMSTEEIERFVRAERELSMWNNWLRVQHAPGMTLSGIRRYLQRLQRRFGRLPSVVVIDYVQLLESGRPAQTREQEVALLSTGLKQIADDLELAIVVLSQVNAEGKARESRRIEHDADAVIHIVPEDESADPVDSNFVHHAVIGKNRYGITAGPGKYPLLFMKRFQRFVEVADRKVGGEAWWNERPRAGVD